MPLFGLPEKHFKPQLTNTKGSLAFLKHQEQDDMLGSGLWRSDSALPLSMVGDHFSACLIPSRGRLTIHQLGPVRDLR